MNTFCSTLFKVADEDYSLVRYLTKACRHGLGESRLTFDEGIIQCPHSLLHKVRSTCKINRIDF